MTLATVFQFRRPFDLAVMLHSVIAGILGGVLITVSALSLSLFVFNGALAASFPTCFSMTMVSMIILLLTGVILRREPFALLRVQDTTVVNLGIISLATQKSLAGVGYGEIEATVIAICMVGATLTGAGLYAIGRFSLTKYLRFVPNAVIGGFLASAGYELFAMAVELLVGDSVTHAPRLLLMDHDAQFRLVAGLGFTGALFAAEYFFRFRLTTPIVILGAVLLYHGVIALFGVTPADLAAHGWVVAGFPDSLLVFPPLSLSQIGDVHLASILAALPGFGLLVLISAFELLLVLTALEQGTGQWVDPDHEFRLAGVSSLFAALPGGMPGYLCLEETLVTRRIGASMRITSFAAACLCLSVLAAGKGSLMALPWPMFGGLLAWSGLSTLWHRLIHGFFKRRDMDTLIRAMIVLIVACVGFYQGIGFGALAGVLLFVVDYARTGAVRLRISGRNFHSSLTQFDDRRRHALDRCGDAILLLRLRGFLFFGSAHGLRDLVEAEIRANPQLAFLVIDFSDVSGVDGVAVSILDMVAKRARHAEVALAFCGMSGKVLRTLERLGLRPNETLLFHADIDQGLIHVEDAMLARVDPDVLAGRPMSPQAWLSELTDSEELAARLCGCLIAVSVAAGAEILTEGSKSDELYLIGEGKVAISITSQAGASVTLATIGPGGMIGELSFYLGVPRTATARAQAPTKLWKLSRENLDGLAQRDPEAALAFHQAVARVLADRVVTTNRLVRYLS